MSISLPVVAVVFGSVAPPQGDIVDLRVHLGCSTEISSFECALQNWDKKYSSGGTYPIVEGSSATISGGRDPNCPLLLTGKVDEVDPESHAVEHYIVVRGRCSGEQLFRRHVTKDWDDVKGEVVIRYVIDNYTSLSHVRTNSLLTVDAPSGQKNVTVANGALFSAGMLVWLKDDNGQEYNEVASVAGNVITMVNNLANTYTVVAAGKVWIDLIEKTDTTYTCLEYEETQVFDVIRYVAETADKTGVIGFDFRIAPDGKFEFFPKNSKTSSVDLSERLEVGSHKRSIARIKNKITIDGAAEASRPPNVDDWTDSLDNWSADEGSLALYSYDKVYGNYSIQCQSATTIINFKRTFDRVKKPQTLKFWLNDEGCGFIANQCWIRLLAPDESNYFELLASQFPVPLPNSDEIWSLEDIALGKGNTYDALKNPTGVWTKTGSPSWRDIRGIKFKFQAYYSGVDALVDGIQFGKVRFEATREDAASQALYGVIERPPETDEELHSDAECDYRAKALIDFLKGPSIAPAVRSTVIDYGTTPILAGDKGHIVLPNENVDANYPLIAVDYRFNVGEATLEIGLQLVKEPQLLADFIYGFRKAIQKLDKYKSGR